MDDEELDLQVFYATIALFSWVILPAVISWRILVDLGRATFKLAAVFMPEVEGEEG
ncbi:hypothetical protein SAMN05443574_103309 [Haloarcula vallismortis]|uniref:Uncharacterized protein n=1 Tax=Haloarcula vallismortis TaxID=28442 RepID=A0A1H2TMW2_HALVA|nr:hypothetical protein [Haloarcula vallismortis]SDW45241.1 hypothetical protein SAMN05443574_103309 [Haloarcula vallismortis]